MCGSRGVQQGGAEGNEGVGGGRGGRGWDAGLPSFLALEIPQDVVDDVISGSVIRVPARWGQLGAVDV